MKHKGDVMYFYDDRQEDLMRAYRAYIASCKFVRMPDLYTTVANMPSKRFWVSDTRACNVVSAIIRDCDSLSNMLPLRREMYMEIYRRVAELRNKHPELSLITLCSMAVEQPAPKFYMTPGSVKVMICKYKKQCREKRLKR